ncbi:MAG: glutamine-hydrolyzing carbamoyl-phosphate synthase small subunit [Elusimicrobia bacterium]|nr:glutamine-hydrolyzing carbamoyl-phosphate synthase small subunit [Elusimicrobiota bacterium]
MLAKTGFSSVEAARVQQSEPSSVLETKLVLSDGTEYIGRFFGAQKNVRGEVVFNTGLTGYVESLTDPSYRGQILVLTYPLQGNYGVPRDRFESKKIQVQGLIVSRYSQSHSHYEAVRSLSEWLQSEGVPALEGIDTRQLTKRLREHGTLEGALRAGDHEPVEGVDMSQAAKDAAWPEMIRYEGKGPVILVIDAGIKESIIRSLTRRGASVLRVPFYRPWESILQDVQGIVIGNGPGDPSDLKDLADRLRLAFERKIPVFGICLGHQLLSLAAGAKTYKLKYGHRSQNQPVKDLTTGRCYITSQNHGYAVDPASLSQDWEPWFVNLNDRTNEGIRHRSFPFYSVQFHPEAAPGPRDTAFLFDAFLDTVRETRQALLV